MATEIETETGLFTPLRYHRQIRDLLRSDYSAVWDWFASTSARSDHNEQVELELLKSTYRMDRDAHESLYALADSVRSTLEITAPVTLYQSQGSSSSSAAIYFTPDHVHIVFMGGLLELLDDAETMAVIAHEMSHYKLWTLDNGDFLTSEQVLTAMSNEPRAETSHHESARNFQLYTEVYADRGALMAVDKETVVSALLKVHTGIKNADAASYLKQADELFSSQNHTTEGLSHPELFIRVRAIQLAEMDQSEEDYQNAICSLIQGATSIHELDLLGQIEFTEQTQRFLLHHLEPAYLRTESVLSHVGYFFPELKIDPEEDQFEVGEPFDYDLKNAHSTMRDYFGYLLLDLISVDPDRDESYTMAAMLTADSLGIYDVLERLLNKELKMTKKDISALYTAAKKMDQPQPSEDNE